MSSDGLTLPPAGSAPIGGRRCRHALDGFLNSGAGLRTYPPPDAPRPHFGDSKRVTQFESALRGELTAHRERHGAANVIGSKSDTAKSEQPCGERPLVGAEKDAAPKVCLDDVWRQSLTGLPPGIADYARVQISGGSPQAPKSHAAVDSPAAPSPGSESQQGSMVGCRKLLLLSRERVHAGQIVEGELREIEVPNDVSILNPAQRRLLHEAELQADKASQALAVARRKHNRLGFVARNRHPNGVLNSESPETGGGEVYQPMKQKIDGEENQRQSERQRRKQFIESSAAKKGAGGPKVLSDGADVVDGGGNYKAANLMQGKSHASRPADTFTFESFNDIIPIKDDPVKRNKHMYNHDGRGRSHNIVTAVALTQIPSDPFS